MTSSVWSLFTEKNETSFLAKCFKCGNWYSYKNSTSGLWRHLKSHHEITPENLKQNQESVYPMARFTGTDYVKEIRNQQARMIVSCNLPFLTVENSEFRRFIQMLKPDVPIISADTVRRDILSQEADFRQKLSLEFKNKRNLVLMTDGWTSNSSTYQLYCLVIAYLGGDGKMKQLLAGVTDVRKTGASDLHFTFIKELKKSGIDVSQFSYMVTDGATNLKSLSDHLQIPRIHCGAHLLHLIVDDIAKMADVSKILGKCKEIAAKLGRSNKLKQMTKEKAVANNNPSALPQSFSQTRWNGARLLLLAVRRHVPTLVCIPEFTDNLFSSKETILMDFIIDIFQPFHTASLNFEKCTSKASELIPTFSHIKRNVAEISAKYTRREDMKDSTIVLSFKSICSRAEKLLTDRITKMKKMNVLKTAMLLDHRFSRTLNNFSEKEWDKIAEELLTTFEDEILDEDLYGTPEQDTSFSDELTSMNDFLSSRSDFSCQKSQRQMAKEELETFQKNLGKTRDFADDPLVYWTMNKKTMPLLSEVAKRLLIIPSSSASTERIFSSAGKIVSNRLRNRLSHVSCSATLMSKAMLGYSRKEESEELYGVLEQLEDTTENDNSISIGDDRIESGDFQQERYTIETASGSIHNLCSTSDGRGDESYAEMKIPSTTDEVKSIALKRAYTPEKDEKIPEPKPKRKYMRKN